MLKSSCDIMLDTPGNLVVVAGSADVTVLSTAFGAVVISVSADVMLKVAVTLTTVKTTNFKIF